MEKKHWPNLSLNILLIGSVNKFSACDFCGIVEHFFIALISSDLRIVFKCISKAFISFVLWKWDCRSQPWLIILNFTIIYTDIAFWYLTAENKINSWVHINHNWTTHSWCYFPLGNFRPLNFNIIIALNSFINKCIIYTWTLSDNNLNIYTTFRYGALSNMTIRSVRLCWMSLCCLNWPQELSKNNLISLLQSYWQ